MKKKLLVSFFSLVMAFVLMTSASFAWFTVSKAPEVINVTTHVEATKNLEIARASSSNAGVLAAPGEVKYDSEFEETEFGGQITDFATATIALPATIGGDNAGELKDKLVTVQYDNTGRTASYTELASPTSTVDGDQTKTITDGLGYYWYENSTNTSVKDAKAAAAVYYVWLRTNAGEDPTDPTNTIKGTAKISATITDVKVARASETTVAADGKTYTAVATPSDADYKYVLQSASGNDAYRDYKKVGIALRVATFANLTSDLTAQATDTNGKITEVQSYKNLANAKFIKPTYTATSTDASPSETTMKYEFNEFIKNCPRNAAILVEIVVYLDGEYFYASDINKDYFVQLGKITFTSDAVVDYEAVNTDESIGAGPISNPNK